MRVLAVASGRFAVTVLEALLSSRHALVKVISKDDKPAGRGRMVRPSPVSTWALERHLPLGRVCRLSDPSHEAMVRGAGAEVGVVVDFGEILAPHVLSWLPLGFYGVHPSLLPRWRGAAPIPWTILAGDTQTGVTVFRLSAQVDAGELALQVSAPVGPRDTAGSLAFRLGQLGGQALVEVLDRLEAGTLRPWSQPHEGCTVARKLGKASARLRWAEDSLTLDRMVRAFNPWPLAWFHGFKGPVNVLRAYPLPQGDSPPGTVLGSGTCPEGEGIRVSCGKGELLLLEIQEAGRRALDAPSWWRGARIPVGARLPEP